MLKLPSNVHPFAARYPTAHGTTLQRFTAGHGLNINATNNTNDNAQFDAFGGNRNKQEFNKICHARITTQKLAKSRFKALLTKMIRDAAEQKTAKEYFATVHRQYLCHAPSIKGFES